MQSTKWVAFAHATSLLSLVASVAANAGCGGTGTATVGSGSSTGSGGGSGLVTSGSTMSGAGGSGLVTSGSVTSGAGGSGSVTSGSGSGSSSGAGSGASSGTAASVCAGAGTKMLTSADTFVDDFEEAMLLPGWYSFNDIPGMPNMFKLAIAAGGAAGTAHAGHYAGMGARTPMAGGFGVGATFNLVIDPSAGLYCLDVSVFDGISFWAKAATAGSKIALNFAVPQTNAATMDSMGRPNGGDCPCPAMPCPACYNHPRVTFMLTTAWANYTAKFADAMGGTAKVGNLIQEIVFISADTNWDFSIDEIAYYKGTPPLGAVGHGDGGM